MGIVRRNTAVIIDGRLIREIFGDNIGGVVEEEIGDIMGFIWVWKEVWEGLEGAEGDWQPQWEDGGFT